MKKTKKHPLETIKENMFNNKECSDFVKGYIAGYVEAVLDLHKR